MAMKFSRPLLALSLSILLAPAEGEAQTCPDAASNTSVTVTVNTGDGSTVPGGSVPLSIYRNGAIYVNTYVAIGGAQVTLGGQFEGSTTYTFAAGGNNHFQSPITGSATCTRTNTGGGGCTISCGGGAAISIYSTRGSYHGQVKTFPKNRQQPIGFRWADSPAMGSNFSTLADGSFQLATADPDNNWSQGVLNGGAGPGSRTANWFVANGLLLGDVVSSQTSSNGNPEVNLTARAPYYEVPPCNKCPKPPDAEGQPVRVTNGEMFLQHTDASVGDLAIVRHYNSNRRTSGRYGILGAGWNTILDSRLAFPESGVIEARTDDGTPSYFVDSNADGTYESVVPPDPLTWIETVGGGGYKKKHATGGEEVYTSTGKLSSVTDPNGVATTYTRNGSGQVTSIARNGRSLSMTYVSGQLRELKDGAGTLLAAYTYEGLLLAGVHYPDKTGYTFGYDASGRLTFVGDQGGRMIERHEYDALSRATTSEIDEGREKYTFTYGPGAAIYENDSTIVTDALNNATVYEFKPVAGILAITKITGPCSSCGGAGDVQEWSTTTTATSSRSGTRRERSGSTPTTPTIAFSRRQTR